MAAVQLIKNTTRDLPRVLGSSTVCVRGIHDVALNQHDNLAAYRRGKGGRGSFNGMVTTVFGASGFLGRYVVHRLAKTGSQVICPYRGDAYAMKDLKLAGDLGQVLFLPYDLRDEESIRKSVKYSNVVINLVGRDWETKNFTYDAVHVEGARKIARVCKEVGVERLLHLSHLNADPHPQAFYVKGGSNFLKSKYNGELAVRDEYPDATVFRPSDMFGSEDRFIRYYASKWRRSLGTVPLYKKGTETIKKPVFCFNVAEGIVNSLQEPSTVGTSVECVGPKTYYLSDIVDYFYRCMRHTSVKRSYMNPFFLAQVKYMSYAPSYPILSMDKLEREFINDKLSDFTMTLEDLGVSLTPLEDRAVFDLKPYRRNNYYEESVGEFAAPEPPPAIV